MVKKKEKATVQKSHDECVRELAEELKANEWDVKANVEGAEKPVQARHVHA